jgi:hypothetical protein
MAAAVIDRNDDISAHPFIISFFSLADNTDKKTMNSTAYRTARSFTACDHPHPFPPPSEGEGGVRGSLQEEAFC